VRRSSLRDNAAYLLIEGVAVMALGYTLGYVLGRLVRIWVP